MDPYSFHIDSANELRLREHIREVLLPYARTHLTSDHVAFTEKVIEELLLQVLEYVPMADATSFHLPTEPLEALIRSLDTLDLTPPEERWATSSEHIRYLRSFFPPPVDQQDLRIEKCWNEDDHYIKLLSICRPISSPILSRRSRHQTPKLGSANYRTFFPHTNSAFIAFPSFNSLPVPSIEDLPTSPVDDVLDLRLKLDSATGTRAFLQSVLVPSTAKNLVDCVQDTPNVPEFLSRESPSRCLPGLDSPPLFSRVTEGYFTHRGAGGDKKNGVNNTTRVSNLVSMLQMAPPELIDGEDGDINSHHMEVVSGRATLKISSPPPPTLHSSDGSEVDELWNISPLGTPATSLMAAKMDEMEIPRIRKFGHGNTSTDDNADHGSTTDLLTAAKSPGFFITSFISAPIPMVRAPNSITSQLEGAESGMHSPHPLSSSQNVSNSLFLQPPSLPEDQGSSASLVDFIEGFEEERFDDAIARIYVSTSQDPLSYIREEKLDGKDVILMDVPEMPPPTAHSREPFFFPERMQVFVVPTDRQNLFNPACHGSNGLFPAEFLRPVKGIKPLVLDLSWRPFNFGKSIPTDEELAKVVSFITWEDEVQGYRDEKYEKTAQVLLDLGASSTLAEEIQPTLTPNFPRVCEEFGTSPAPRRPEEIGHTAYLLTQRERLRASGANITLDAEAEVQDDSDSQQGIPSCSHIYGHEETLLQDESSHQFEEYHGPRNPFDLMEYCYENPSYTFDDSGIDIIDNNVGQLSTSELGAPHPLLHEGDLRSRYTMDTLEANKENVDCRSEDKENVPPRDGDNQYRPDFLASQYDWSGYFDFPESEPPSVEPLAYSRPLVLSDNLTNSVGQDVPPLTPSVYCAKRPKDVLISINEHGRASSGATKRRRLDDLVPASSKDLFSTFIRLRNQGTPSHTIEHSETRNDSPAPHEIPDAPEQMIPRAAPDDVFDQHTVRLPEHWIPAATIHHYLVSMALIQKRALVRELQGHHCRAVLVERYDLSGTDIIIDPDHGVLFIPLLALPANIDTTVERISGESWRYLSLLIVLEAFPSSHGYKADYSRVNIPVLNAYTPPICKAIKKLRRNLGIAEGCGTLNPDCAVTWAFANDIEEAAKFVRCFGEEACATSTRRGKELLWGEREWLEEEEREGEPELAKVQGMNAFAAFVMLYDMSLEMILDLSPEARLAEFGPLLGQERLIGLNAVIESRLRQIAPDVEDSVAGPGY